MKKIVVSASSMPAGRNMNSQLEYLVRVGTYGADMYHLDIMDGEYTKYKTLAIHQNPRCSVHNAKNIKPNIIAFENLDKVGQRTVTQFIGNI